MSILWYLAILYPVMWSCIGGEFIFYVFIFPDDMTDVWDNIGEYCLNEMSPDMFMVLYVIL